ncbi:hypothetical protein HN695_07945 [Candidatus Woesearchaeota archaeon]|jgi:hypothetical protein|nr:hypothetical protein [Candidatus Woesearchaeota archaeon]MBT5272473.1 hypothetical protein [Candidatus Woesearchaeota archaeon]MBT6041519.1 hypothetical protein [Candidatus Woesearchaeota archaeon]MBT6336335.1 hypothetical protein [Candidatus Woesearchaeota archaeon]MBT7928237.1 hypothetical protein [Candidatus Woesearchaeota archaeon]
MGGLIKKLAITAFALYFSAVGIRAFQTLRSDEVKQTTQMADSALYLSEQILKDHPEYVMELRAKDTYSQSQVDTFFSSYIGHEKRMDNLECMVKRVYMPWKKCGYTPKTTQK